MPDFFLFSYEYERLEFSETFGFLKFFDFMIILLKNEYKMNIRIVTKNRIKMIIGFYLCIKMLIHNNILNPWRVKNSINKDDILLKKLYIYFLKFLNYFFLFSNLKAFASIIHHLFIDYIDSIMTTTNSLSLKFKSDQYKYKLITKPLGNRIFFLDFISILSQKNRGRISEKFSKR